MLNVVEYYLDNEMQLYKYLFKNFYTNFSLKD